MLADGYGCPRSTISANFTEHGGLINRATLRMVHRLSAQQKEAAIRTASFASFVFDNNFDNEFG